MKIIGTIKTNTVRTLTPLTSSAAPTRMTSTTVPTTAIVTNRTTMKRAANIATTHTQLASNSSNSLTVSEGTNYTVKHVFQSTTRLKQK